MLYLRNYRKDLD